MTSNIVFYTHEISKLILEDILLNIDNCLCVKDLSQFLKKRTSNYWLWNMDFFFKIYNSENTINVSQDRIYLEFFRSNLDFYTEANIIVQIEVPKLTVSKLLLMSE